MDALPTPLEAVKALWKAYARNGYDGVLDTLDPDAHWAQRDGSVLHGRAEIRAFIEGMRGDGIEVELQPYSFEERGPWVLVTGGMRTRSRHGLADTQRCWAYRVKSGRPVEVRTLTSRDEALRAIGALGAAA